MTDGKAGRSTRRVARDARAGGAGRGGRGRHGAGVYWVNDASQAEQARVGDTEAADRVSVTATIEKVDPARYSATVRVWLVPRGPVHLRRRGDGEPRDPGGPAASTAAPWCWRAVVAVQHSRLRSNFTAGRSPTIRSIGMRRTSTSRRWPTARTSRWTSLWENNDAFFNLTAGQIPTTSGTGLHLKLSRSPGTFMMVALMFCVMWARRRRRRRRSLSGSGWAWCGRPWRGWPRRCLALAAFRGTAPGNPPIGSVLDYTAFLWAEAIVACSLTVVVIRGVLQGAGRHFPETR